ncbi:hypothetical protein DSM112329_03142 [Paraconexibacter sp. AEG42_29]|uniref:Uncharacterized protein n=1 Tax=Paraconexibacter sp. AEG42_29 TaxID=2997339 RepID=A0AAU7AXX3_9ACTN
MDAPLVSCQDCSRTWHSRTMADGLRTIGHCPRCSGTLAWAEDAGDAAVVATPAGAAADVAPHLVLGLPRR